MRPDELTADVLEPFLPKLQEIDLDKDKRPLGVAKILAETASIQAAADWVMDQEPWDFMAVYFDGIDYFGHGFMKYHPPRQDWLRAVRGTWQGASMHQRRGRHFRTRRAGMAFPRGTWGTRRTPLSWQCAGRG